MHRIWIFAGLAAALAPSAAFAVDGPGTPVPIAFPEVACMQVVDRQAESVFHVDYEVPEDDLERTEAELEDSRTHQFLAFNRQRYDFALPLFISQADFDRAEANDDLSRPYGAQDVLETAPDWPANSWVRITPDAPRVPISTERAADGIDWDISQVELGAWLVAGYTFEPDTNDWQFRLGGVRIIDSSRPGEAAPAAFLNNFGSGLIEVGQPAAMSGCIDAPEGTTYSLSWARLEQGQEPVWEPFVVDEPAVNGDLAFDFEAPPQAGGETGTTIKLQLTVTDPSGRSYSAFTPFVIRVAPYLAEAQDEGGGCRVSGRPPTGRAAWLAALLALGLWRRRRSPARI